MRLRKRIIAVIGTREPSAEEARTAEAVGRELARRGVTLICGGMGGVMEAACRGASAAGGTTIGVLPGDRAQEANPHVQIPLVTGMGYARNVIIIKSAQAVIAIGGSYGTLSEIAHALQRGIPVIGLHTWSLARQGVADESIIQASDAAEAVEIALNLSEGADFNT